MQQITKTEEMIFEETLAEETVVELDVMPSATVTVKW